MKNRFAHVSKGEIGWRFEKKLCWVLKARGVPMEIFSQHVIEYKPASAVKPAKPYKTPHRSRLRAHAEVL